MDIEPEAARTGSLEVMIFVFLSLLLIVLVDSPAHNPDTSLQTIAEIADNIQ